MNLPNKLTLIRFVMAFIFVALMAAEQFSCSVIAYLVFTVATITDYYDGKIARARNLVTNFGKLLDPVADKVLIMGAFVVLMENHRLQIPGWTIVVILGREFLITGARSLAAVSGAVIGANIWGKTKAVVQMVYVFVFLFFALVAEGLDQAGHAGVTWAAKGSAYYGPLLLQTSWWAMVAVALFTVYSGVQFMRSNWRALNLGNDL